MTLAHNPPAPTKLGLPIVSEICPVGSLGRSCGSLLSNSIASHLKMGSQAILIDLKEVPFIDSSGLGGLVKALKLLRKHQVRLSLCSLNGQIRMLLELTQLHQLFEILDSKQEFYSKYTNYALLTEKDGYIVRQLHAS